MTLAAPLNTSFTAAFVHAVKMAGPEVTSELAIIATVLDTITVDAGVKAAKAAVATITWRMNELSKLALVAEEKR